MEGLVGRRIELIEMPNDPDPIPKGTRGTVTGVVHTGFFGTQIWVDWDIDRSLMLVVPPDTYRVIEEETRFNKED